jgi:Pyruvate-formate lyase-activating enzyme
MLKYYDSAVVFSEIPDEITLAIDITSCPHMCKNCHSPWLREDIGTVLSEAELDKLIQDHFGITCVCFMGGDSDHNYIKYMANYIHNTTHLKVGMYSGDDELDRDLVPVLDYYKIGGYIPEKGPLNNPNTNQRLFHIQCGNIKDITYRFIKN